MKNKSKTEYKTKDLGESAALLCKSARLLRLEKESDFYWFIFSDADLCQELSNRYWFGEILINARSYQDALQTLKNRLFAQK